MNYVERDDLMKSKIFKHIFTTIFLSAIPAFLSYLSSSELIFDYLIKINLLGEAIDVPFIQDCCLWSGIALSAIFLSLQLIIVQIRLDSVQEERNLLIKMSKDIVSRALAESCTPNPQDFDIRFFIPKHPVLYSILDFLHIQGFPKKFIIKNIELIADQGTTKNLEFEVSPHCEGLVGQCYCSKGIMFDDNLEINNNSNYNLGHNQIQRTSSLKWSICCPIVSEDNKVVAILAIDGQTKMTIKSSKKDSLFQIISGYSRMLYDNVPPLFRR